MRVLTLSFAVLLACCSNLVESPDDAQGQDAVCASGTEAHLVIATAEGSIVARLLESAAPQAVRQLSSLLKEPTSGSGAPVGSETVRAGGYYDGLTFIESRPHVEIATDVRESETPLEIPTQIDAVALGLDRQRIDNAGRAMDLAQRELAPAYKRMLGAGSMNPRLQEWMDRLHSTHDASFLVGVSQQEINEALGYVYQEGLESEPVTEGALMLKPLSPRVASARLSIALTDIPQRTGRWMVVGRVVEGLETAKDISARPLADPATVRSRTQPRDPVLIESIRLDCRPHR